MPRFVMFAAAALAASCWWEPAAAQEGGSATIAAIRAKGELACGVSTGVAGFSLADSRGVVQGIDADTCRAVAAAVLGEPKVRFVLTTTQNRFVALQAGEIDVLVRSTTWTLGREANLGLLFAGVNFYDGAGFMVRSTSGVKSAKELDGATVCVQPGTSTELVISDYFRVNGIKATPVLIEDQAEVVRAYLSNRCDALAIDQSALASIRFQQGDRADEHVILPDVISKEPLGVAVRKGDDKFYDLVRWTLFALLQAEESGVTRANVEDLAKTSANPDIRRLLGGEGDMGKALGVDNRWAVDAVRAVGNYGEIWTANIAPLGLQRGINNLWTKGGLHYAPPIR